MQAGGMGTTWKIAESGPDEHQLAAVAATLGAGGVVILPTDTLYGLHAVAADEAAIERIADMKGRDRGQPMIVLVAGIDQLDSLGAAPGHGVLDLLREVWPSPLTAIVPLEKTLPASRGRSTVAVRMPAVTWLRRLVRLTGPLVSTSVNRTGETPFRSTGELPEEIRSAVEGIVDAGPLGGEPSTIVDFTTDPPELVRQGAFLFTQKLRKTLRKSL